MPLILTYGEAGNGKSTQYAAVAKYSGKRSIYLCMEVKDDKLLQWMNVPYAQIIQYNDMYEEDGIATLTRLESEIRKIIRDNQYDLVILDGISDIRKFAQKEWIFRDNLIRAKDGKGPRSGISGENKGAWAAINQRVMGILEPLINWSNIKKTTVMFTAQMKDSYMNDQKVGRQIAAGDWIEFDVDVKCKLYRTEDGTYMAHFTKVPGWATALDEDVVVAKEGYYGLLLARGIITVAS